MKIIGKVIDAQTKEPIPFANVYFSKNSAGIIGPSMVGTTTNEFGRYRLEWPADTWITASMAGYQKKTVKLPYDYSDQEVNFDLEPGINIPEVEIIAKPIKTRSKLWIIAALVVLILGAWMISRRRV